MDYLDVNRKTPLVKAAPPKNLLAGTTLAWSPFGKDQPAPCRQR
jgi:hypothetical protein